MRLIDVDLKKMTTEGKIPNAEMSDVDHAFLYYLLDKFKPKKILEVGVAAGGTSCFLLKHTGYGQDVYGVDIMTSYYRIPSEPVGFMIKNVCSPEERARHTLLLGKDIIDCMEEIGADIDFCLLDTNHVLPGELLQFFAVYPYLKAGACLALHDISLNFHPGLPEPITSYRYASYSNKLLFCALASKCKMLPKVDWPNIGALVIDDETRRGIDSTFFALGISWFYNPGSILNKYEDFINRHYDSFCQTIFKGCIKNQAKLVASIPK